MIERFAHVFYWTACGCAVAWVFLAALIFNFELGGVALLVAGIPASLIWLTGRAVRYILIGY